MNRNRAINNNVSFSVPRACGDEPIGGQSLTSTQMRSPRMRG